MLELTAANRPDGNFHRRMAIIMDDKVLSAPNLNSPISNSGQITGNFTQEEVEFLVTILRSGRLPATLSEEPVSENRVGAGLGATTIQKGKSASLWAIIATFICILIYYRFSGVVASMALILNGILIFGIMIFIGQPLTLAGLAGLVLTIGMSVDANVLIFERIREEKAKGSAPRMSIRNGFDRAFTTIIDANLTTLIAAVVLYWIGTDQVRGFAVALIIGILTSMFTATFCSRIVFEIAEKLKIVSLSMSDGVGFVKRTFFGDRDLDFMSMQKLCVVLSIITIIVGMVAVVARGPDILNIDFTGGTSVTFQLNEPVEPDRLRQMIKTILPADKQGKPVQFTLVAVEKEPVDTVYTMVCSIDDEDFLSRQLANGFTSESEASLKTYRVKVLGTSQAKLGSTQKRPATVRLVAFRASQDPSSEADTSNESATDETQTAPDLTTNSAQGIAESTGSDDLSADLQVAESSEGTPSEANSAESGVSGVAPSVAASELIIEFSGSTDDNPGVDTSDKGAKVDADTLRDNLTSAAAAIGLGNKVSKGVIEVYPDPLPKMWTDEDITGFPTWRVKMPVDEAEASRIVDQLQKDMSQQPLWLSLSKIGSRVAGEMQQRAIAAILLSLVFIVAYIWFRFQKVEYGVAAVIALVHDVMITLGVLAICHWLSGPLKFLLIEDFKIGLTEVAAFLTIIGYSLNDTIVVFDRIREVRGRSPRLTAKMVNDSVNQTLSRTLLTSGTTLLTVLLLYVFGGEGIHAFAFALLVGILVGTYSSIFVAAPVLLWLSNRKSANQPRSAVAVA